MSARALNDRVMFPRWVYENYQYSDVGSGASCDVKEKGKANTNVLFPHQTFVKNFIAADNPYRGLLLFHGLGSGKSCSSISAVESFLRVNPPVYVFLPASLSPNYKKELQECAEVGFQNRSWFAFQVKEKEVSRVAACIHVDSSWIRNADDRVICWYDKEPLKEALAQGWIEMIPGKPKKALVKTSLDYIMDNHFEFVHYNGLTKTRVKAWEEKRENPFDNSLVVIDEAHNFISRVVHGSTIAKTVYKLFMSAKNAKFVLLSGTPLINDPFELCYMLNLLRGEIRTYGYKVLKTSKELPSLETVWAALEDAKMSKYVNSVEVSVEKRAVLFHLLPDNFVWNQEGRSSGMVKNDTASWSGSGDMSIIEKIHEHVQKKLHLGKAVEKLVSYALPNDRETFMKLFVENGENSAGEPEPRCINHTLFMNRIQGVVSYLKSAGENLMPQVLDNTIVKVPLSNHQFKHYQTVRALERKMALKGRGNTEDSGNVYRAFSRMACNFVFPTNIKRPFPSDLKKDIDMGDDEKKVKKDTDKNDKNEEKKAGIEKKEKEYESVLKGIREKLLENSDDFLRDNLAEYSPKFAAVIQNLAKSAGTSLLYTQFRSMEGIGLFGDALKAHEWVQMDVIKSPQGWRFVEPLSQRAKGVKRFIVFPAERDRAEVLMDIYNGRWDKIPASLKAEINDAGYTTNLRGELVKLLMITQSGAEGISLRNVRQVHILEPYWNQIRLDQVIGRAVRACSHQELPLNERNVQVFTYVATLTSEQLQGSFTIRRMDKSLTSDEHILMIAHTKSRLVKEFLAMLEMAAVDCVVHASKNNPMKGCFAHPINQPLDDRAFQLALEQEIKDYMRPRVEKKQKIPGAVISHPVTGVKVIQDQDTGLLYDYRAYKYARVLHPVT